MNVLKNKLYVPKRLLKTFNSSISIDRSNRLIKFNFRGFMSKISSYNRMNSLPASKFNNFSRSFSRQNKGKKNSPPSKQKYVKPIDVGAYTATKEPIIQLDNGYYLLYYHRQNSYTMMLLYLRFLIPLAILMYLIKKNPFYKSYPIVLPLALVAFVVVFFKMIRYGNVTNRMIHQILLDPSGTEATFIYKNKLFRKLRSDTLEEVVLVQSLVNPPQENEYRPLKGPLFPEKFPFNFEILDDLFYFWK